MLIVDEAHGAHFGLHPDLPRSAQQLGAGISIQSTHKTLGALTQAAMLHISQAAPQAVAKRLPASLRLLHSSSPSYLLMASLDAAAHAAANARNFDAPLACAAQIRAVLRTFNTPLLDGNLGGSAAACGHDPLRITFAAAPWGMTGFQLLAALEAQGCSAEMATQRTAVLALGIGSVPEHADALSAALAAVRCRPAISKEGAVDTRWSPGGQLAQGIDMRSAQFAARCYMPLAHSSGHRSAEAVSVYPPGIPVLCPGEVITREAVETLMRARRLGATIVGLPSKSAIILVID